MVDHIERAILRHRKWSRLAVLLRVKACSGNVGPLSRLGAAALLRPVRLLRYIAVRRLLIEEADNVEQARQKFFYIAALMMTAKLKLNRKEIARVTLSLGRFRTDVLS